MAACHCYSWWSLWLQSLSYYLNFLLSRILCNFIYIYIYAFFSLWVLLGSWWVCSPIMHMAEFVNSSISCSEVIGFVHVTFFLYREYSWQRWIWQLQELLLNLEEKGLISVVIQLNLLLWSLLLLVSNVRIFPGLSVPCPTILFASTGSQLFLWWMLCVIGCWRSLF